jgi:hypothetical protein
MTFTSLGFIAILVVPALDQRFGWSTVPVAFVVLGDVLVAIGFYFIFLVYRENTYAAATVEVAAGQTVITTGPYAIVRHPMYASGALYMFGTPLALGSYWGFDGTDLNSPTDTCYVSPRGELRASRWREPVAAGPFQFLGARHDLPRRGRRAREVESARGRTDGAYAIESRGSRRGWAGHGVARPG